MKKDEVIAKRNELYQLFTAYDFRDKGRSFMHYCIQYLNRTQRMFEYSGLPDTIPAEFLERYLQMSGYAVIGEWNGKLYAFLGVLGGESKSPYYDYTWCTVSNSPLNCFKTYKIGEDCVIIKNDANYEGLRPIIARYSTALVENDISMEMMSKNMRVTVLIKAPNDDVRKEAEIFIEDVSNGKQSAIGGADFLEGMEVFPMSGSSSQRITDLIEYHQYLKAGLYNELGLQSNFNMKRESINEAETGMNDDVLIPLIDEMFYQRQEGVKRLNEMFGLNVTVKLSSIWEQVQKEIKTENTSESTTEETPEKEGEEDEQDKTE
ncbi:MAG: hypothetical protein J6Y60_05400 [Treponema sp.]|nr:hypothetical protein [Treponema sp.]